MIEPLRYHIEKNPPHAIKKAVFCERCINNKKLRSNPQLATKYCAQCARFHYLCKGCEDYLHSFVKTKDHVRLIVVIGPAVRKKIIRRGNAKQFPKLFDICEVKFKTSVTTNGKLTHQEPAQLLKFPSGVSGTCVHIQILGGKKLPISDSHGTSDPFVCISYGGTKLGTTRTRPRTINPRWTNETYVVPVDQVPDVHNSSVKKHSKHRDLIKLEVFDRDYWNFNDFLGHVELTRQQLLKLTEHSNCKPIRLSLTLREYHGCLGIKAGISADIFHLMFDRAEDLDRMDAVGLSDPYCVLHFRGKVVGKTPRIDNTLNPVWTSGNVMTLSVADVIKEETRLRMLANHGLTPHGPTRKEILEKSYIFTIQMYDHNSFRADGLLGTVRINCDQLRKLCPHLPVKEEDIKVGTSLSRKSRRMSNVGEALGIVGRRFRNSISVAAGSIKGLRPKTPDPSVSAGQSASDSYASSQLHAESSSLLTGSGLMESSKSLQSGSEEESAKSSHIEDNSSSSVSADGSLPSKTHNNQEDDGVTNAQHLHSEDNRNDDDDMDEDKGDDYGGSDDGSVYRRPKSPSFDINPNDELEEDTFDALHNPRQPNLLNNEAIPLLSKSKNNAMTKLDVRNLDNFEEKSGMFDIDENEDLTDDENDDEDEKKDAENSGVVNEELTRSQRRQAEDEDLARGDIYDTNQRFFADRQLERLGSALDGAALLEEGSDDDCDSIATGMRSKAERSNIFENEDDDNALKKKSRRKRKSSSDDVDDDDDALGEDDDSDDDSDDHSSVRGEKKSSRDSDEESGVYEEPEDTTIGKDGSRKESVTSMFSRLRRTNSAELTESLRRKKEQLELTLKGPLIEWGNVKFYDVQKDADQNVTDVDGDDRGQLIVRLIKSSRGHVIRGLDVGVSHMTLGETSRLKIRYDYGYGNFWMGSHIPPRSNLSITCKLVSINGGSGLKVWRQWLRLYRQMRRCWRETRTTTRVACASCLAFIGLMREKYRLYKNPPYESESDDDSVESSEESSVSSDSEESDDDEEIDPYTAKVDINDSNRALYAGARAMWGYDPNKPKFIPYDPARRLALQQKEEKRLAKERKAAEKQALRIAKAKRRLEKDGLFDSDSDDEDEDEGDDEDGGEDEGGMIESGRLSRASSSQGAGSALSRANSQSRKQLLDDRSGSVGRIEDSIQRSSSGLSNRSGSAKRSPAGSQRSQVIDNDGGDQSVKSGISGLVSEDSGLISKSKGD